MHDPLLGQWIMHTDAGNCSAQCSGDRSADDAAAESRDPGPATAARTRGLQRGAGTATPGRHAVAGTARTIRWAVDTGRGLPRRGAVRADDRTSRGAGQPDASDYSPGNRGRLPAIVAGPGTGVG